MSIYKNSEAIKRIVRDYAKKHNLDPERYEASFRYLRNERVKETDAYKRTRKYEQQWQENERKAKQRNFENILKTIKKGKDGDVWVDNKAKELNDTLNGYRNFYGSNINQPISQADLSNFKKYMDYLKKSANDKKVEEKTNAVKSFEKHPAKKKHEENNFLEKLIKGNAVEADDPDRGGLLGILDKTLGRVSHQANKTLLGDMFVDPSEKQIQENPLLKEAYSKSDNALEKGSDIAGSILGYTAPLGTAYKVTGKGAQLGYKGLDKLVQTLNKGKGITKGSKYVNDAVKGAAAMGAYSTAREGLGELTTPDSATLSERLKRVGIETAGGAIGDPIARLVGTGIKIGGSKVLSKFFGKNDVSAQEIKQAFDNPDVPQEIKQEILALPEGPRILALPEGKTQTAIPFRHTQNEYTQKFNRLIEEANKIDMYPGREREIVEDLWNRIKDYEDPSLDELIDLATPNFRNQQALNNPNLIQQARQNQNNAVYGLDNLFNRLKKVNEPLQTPNKGNPLIFKRTIEQPKQQGLQEVIDTLKNVNNPKPKQNLNTLKSPIQEGSTVNKTGNLESTIEMLKNLNKNNQSSKEGNLRGFIDTLQKSKKPTPELLEDLNLKKTTYEPISNKTTVQQANNRIDKGIEDAIAFINGADKFTAEHVATGLRLIDDLQNNGDVGRAVDVAELLAKKGTEAGQTVQAFAIYNRLSPEGILIHANRIADRTNQKLSKFSEKVKIDEETATTLTDLATSVQAMTEQKTVANNVISLMDKAKKGTQLSDDELKTVARFVEDAKQFIGDITPKGKPKPPKPIQNKEVRIKVVKFLDSQEAAARKRIAERRNRINSLPVDVFYDYAVIGASKIAKGTINLADFADDMIREFGDEVKPYVEQIYRKAVDMIDTQVGRTKNTRLSDIEKITNNALKTAKITEQEATSIREFAKKVGEMSGDARDEASMELQATLQLLERPSLLQQISTTQTIAQLLNPKTIVRNSLGNELFYRTERLNKMIATPIDWTRSKITGGQRTVTFATNNQGKYWKNWLKGAKAGWKGVSPDGLQTRYDLRPNSFRSDWNPLKYMEKSLGAALQSFDYAGYKRAVNHTIGELATLRATNEGLKGQAKKEAIERYIREVDENVLAIADEYGKYATFQDNNIIAVGLQKFKRGLNLGKDFGFGDFIIKYPKTPGALIARSLEYSPAGFLRSIYTIANAFKQGEKINVRDVSESLTRAMIGTGGITGVAWFLADKGILTGTGGTDWDIQELERQSGKAEYSLNITALNRWVMNNFDEEAAEVRKGDRYISYNWAQPIAISMSLGANAQRKSEEPGETDYLRSSYELASGAFDTMVDQSVLSGLKDAFNIYPGQSVLDKTVDIAGNLPSSFVPTAFNQARQLSDNTSRNTYDPNKFQEFINRALNRVPAVEKNLPPGYDTFGNKKEVYQGGTNNLFNVLLNPAYVRKYNPSPEAEMVLEVINDTGDSRVAPRRAVKFLKSGGERFDLTPEQYSEYQRRLGEATKEGLNSLLTSRGGTDSEHLAGLIYDMLNDVGKKVREQMKLEVIPGYKSK